MTFTLAPAEQTDAELLHRIGSGDPEAAGRLWVRLWPQALTAARGLVDADEVPGLAAEALVGTLAAVALGTGPVDDATGFVVAAVHELGEDEHGGLVSSGVIHPDVFPSRTLAESFSTLAVEDRRLLWAVAVEGRGEPDLARGLGLTAAGVAVEHDQALGRLQQSYLRRHSSGAETPDCVDTHAFLGAASTTAALDPSPEIPERTWVHLSECAVCTEAFHELAHTDVALGALLGTAADPGPIPVLVPAPVPEPVLAPVLAAVLAAAEPTAPLEAVLTDEVTEEIAAVVPAAAGAVASGPARRKAESRWRRPLVLALGAAVLASVVGVSVGVARHGDPDASPAASAAPESDPTLSEPSESFTEPSDRTGDPTTTPTPKATATAAATAAAAAATAPPVVAPKPTTAPTPRHTARPAKPSTAPKPAPTTSAPSGPATSAPPATPTPTATPTKHCNVLQVLLGCRPS